MKLFGCWHNFTKWQWYSTPGLDRFRVCRKCHIVDMPKIIGLPPTKLQVQEVINQVEEEKKVDDYNISMCGMG